jgi:hypothetical protein
MWFHNSQICTDDFNFSLVLLGSRELVCFIISSVIASEKEV